MCPGNTGFAIDRFGFVLHRGSPQACASGFQSLLQAHQTRCSYAQLRHQAKSCFLSQSSILPSLGNAKGGFGELGRIKFRRLSLPSLARLVDHVASKLPWSLSSLQDQVHQGLVHCNKYQGAYVLAARLAGHVENSGQLTCWIAPSVSTPASSTARGEQLQATAEPSAHGWQGR